MANRAGEVGPHHFSQPFETDELENGNVNEGERQHGSRQVHVGPTDERRPFTLGRVGSCFRIVHRITHCAFSFRKWAWSFSSESSLYSIPPLAELQAGGYNITVEPQPHVGQVSQP